jgi:diamine N-acetyltransferase
MTVMLCPVTQENWRAVAHLEVPSDQKQFVAPNSYSLAEAAYEPGLTPVAISTDETLVGFAMYTHEPFQGEWPFTQTPYQGELGIVRLMVDKQYQHRGYGRQAILALIDRMRRLPGGQTILINVISANHGARRLYESVGFVVYEENNGGSWAKLTTSSVG